MRRFSAFAVAVAASVVIVSAASAQAQPKVLAVHFSLDINPVSQDYVNHEIDKANNGGYSAVVILLDTPGGLSTSMEKIYEKILASRVPVIVYVSPEGAGAASAGVFVAQASDLLAMAPATNIGSSTPINQSGGNLGSDLKLNVIDVKAPDLRTLLNQIDGRVTYRRHITLHTANAQIVEAHPGFFSRLLNVLIDPNIITLLFLAGLAGIGFEIFHPGVVLPGVLGAVALVTALFGFSVLPISWAGLMLLLLGVAMLVIDAFVTSHGAITVAGLISLVVGAIMLFRNAPSPYHVSVPLLVSVAVVLGSVWVFAITKAVQVRRKPVSVGPQSIVGQIGEVRGEGQVFVNGELWRARPAGDEPLRRGAKVQVTSIDPSLVLDVSPVVEPIGSPQTV